MEAKIANKPVFNEATGLYDYKLKTGQMLTIRKGKTKQMTQAQTECEGNSSLVTLLMVSYLCTLDGKKLVLEDWEDLDLAVGIEVIGAFSAVNLP
jgi:hypothetical protein